ncbi:unnamed protein product [Ilex paraguariensis]|uniref:Secreted protein n=1 Tax=Ilex paraguariensis TaxID=185542 RepID=A0ABC8SC68_9AQUA
MMLNVNYSLCIFSIMSCVADNECKCRLARTASRIDSSHGGVTRLFGRHCEGQLDWSWDMSCHRVLFAARTHPSIWWFQKFLYKNQWHFEYCWHNPSVGLSSMGADTLHPIGTITSAASGLFSICKSEPYTIYITIWFVSWIV